MVASVSYVRTKWGGSEMNATEINFAVREPGVRLSVTEADRIEYRPKSRMTPELLGEIRANKEVLIRDVLMADALRYLSKRYVEGTGLSAMDALESQLEYAYADGDLVVACSEAIRAYVRAGLREVERAKPAGEASEGGCVRRRRMVSADEARDLIVSGKPHGK
jgi:hypothetical protein